MNISTPVPQDNQNGQNAAFAPGLTPAAPISPPPPIGDAGLAARDFARRVGGQPCLSSEAVVRNRGAQEGNQNARKHGLYAKYLSPKQRQDFDEARGVRGVEDELALFRCKLAEMVETEPWNWILLNRIANTILKLEAALPEETPEANTASRSTRIMSGFFTYALGAGDPHVTKAFNEWMEKNHPVAFVPENESHVQPEADST